MLGYSIVDNHRIWLVFMKKYEGGSSTEVL